MALDTSRILPQDPFRALPKAVGAPQQTVTEHLSDDSLFSENLSAIQERLKNGEERILKTHPEIKSVIRAGFSEGMSETAIINSNGIEKCYTGTHYGMGVSCLAEKDGERQEGGYGMSKRFRKDLDWTEIFDSATRRTLALLGGKPIATGNLPVVFDPSVASEFLDCISGMVCAETVQKGKSPFKDRLNAIVASKLVSIVDDGTLDKGLATSPIDDEGVPTQKTPVITDGKLEHFLYDSYSAAKDRTQSTGNAVRAGFKSSPSSGTSNFYLLAGRESRKNLLAGTRGLYLYDVLGLHMADPISGDFSVGAIGAWIENGEFKYAVRGITLAGNLPDLLKNIDSVCDDLTFFGSTGSPTFRVSQMTVSGQ